MISVDKSHPVFAQRCRDLVPGESAYSLRAEIPYDVHYYRDGWHIYWKSPPNGQIGRKLRSRRQLLAFLAGDWNRGISIRSLSIRM